jgi:hypothetical protein
MIPSMLRGYFYAAPVTAMGGVKEFELFFS